MRNELIISPADDETGPESIGEVSYINKDQEHAMISIYNPALLNGGPNFVQVVISIDGAVDLRAHLNAFLHRHGVVAN